MGALDFTRGTAAKVMTASADEHKEVDKVVST